MKIRLYISALLLPLVLLNAIFLPAGPVEASSILKWEEVDKPGERGYIVINPSDISKIAVGTGNIIYAVDSINNMLYRSDNGGQTWKDITNNLLRAGAKYNLTDVAVAADGPAFVAVVSNDGTKVFLSSDSGVSWNDTGLNTIAGTIQCIAISNSYRPSDPTSSTTETKHNIAVGTAYWNGIFTGQIWMLAVGTSFPSWTNQSIANADISRIAFSSNYNSDNTILAVASTYESGKQNTYLYKGWWNNSLFDWDYPTTGSPLLIASENSVDNITSSLSLPTGFNGTDETSRTVFVSYSAPGSANKGVYRSDYLWNSSAFNRMYAGTENITSIAYSGTLQTGKMLIGFTDQQPGTYTVMIKRASINQSESSAAWYPANMPPTGPCNANVAWGYTGSDNITPAFCGTGRTSGSPENYNESAFSRSTDYGNNWEQTSLINTDLLISDIAPFPDSRGLLMTSTSPYGPEGIWRSAGEPIGTYWSRVKTINTTTDRIILRTSPNYKEDYTIYAAVVNNQDDTYSTYVADNKTQNTYMLSSHCRGNYWNQFYVPWPVVDFAVQDNLTVYIAIDGGYVRKTSDGCTNFGTPVWTGLDDINMISLSPNGHILAGSRDCKVAYSTDGGASFSTIGFALDEQQGDAQVIADPQYATNHIIYAADNLSDGGVWRWIIGSSNQWQLMDEELDMLSFGEKFCGLATGPEGTLYALRSENSENSTYTGGMNRTLNPAAQNEYTILWDQINKTLPPGTGFNPLINFSHTLPHLKISGNDYQNDLWAVDLNNNMIYRFTDTLCKTGPVLTGTDSRGCDPSTGRSQDVDLTWQQPSLGDLDEVQLAGDPSFSIRLSALEPPENPYMLPVEENGAAACILPGDQLECGSFFYWRVRVRHATTTENITSPWSDTLRFAVQPGYKVTASSYGVRLLNPENGCSCPCSKETAFSWSPYFKTTAYRFQLADNAEMKNLLVDTAVNNTTSYLYPGELQCNHSYYWRVKAIQPTASDWSATFNLKTQATISASTDTILPRSTPAWVWVLIGICLVLCTSMLVLILRRYYS